MFIASCLLGMTAAAQQAVVRSYDAPELEVGQAWLVHSGERCIGVLPHHVAAETSLPSLLREGAGALRGEAVTVVDLGEDAAIALMSGTITRQCGPSLGSVSRGVERHLKGAGLGTLRYINGDGTVGRLAVTVVDDDGEQLLRVQPTSPDERIRKGQSGSLLIVNDQSVGMLLSVNARSGIGTVMRTDALLGKVEAQLRKPATFAAPVATSAPSAAAQALSNTATRAGNSGVWSVVAWDIDPVGSAHIAANLTAVGIDGYWSAQAPDWPVAIELGGPDSVILVQGVAFQSASGIDPAQLPGHVQVLTTVDAERPAWRVAGSSRLAYLDGIARIAFPPARAPFMRIEFFAT